MRRSYGLPAYCFLLLLFLFAPTITILIFSFDGSGRGSLPLGALSAKWYRESFGDSLVRDSFKYSAIVAGSAALIAIVLATLGALALYRHRSRLAAPIIVFVALPLALPPLVLGIALLSFFHVIGLQLSLMTVTIGHLLITMPIVLLTLNARLSNFDRSFEEAARDLGARPWQMFLKVTFPLIRPSVVGAGLLVLAFSLDEFIVTLYTIGPRNTVPLLIWGQMRIGVSPSVNAISTVLLLATLVLVVVMKRLGGMALGSQRNA